jgi:putative PIN family toxin of toxin-antitoxin system
VRAVLDANVLVCALISPVGPSGRIVSAWAAERFELVVSPMLPGELSRVLARPKFRRWVSEQAAAEFVLGLKEAALLIADPTVRPQVSRDPDDDYLVALAQAADADVLVSGDGDLIDLVNSDPAVLSPRAFLEHLAR